MTTPTVRGRLLGVDAARGVALLGMAAVHVLPAETDSGTTTLAHSVAAGRSAALFAVLAGVGIALLTGGPRPVAGRTRARARLALVVRGLLVGGIGLLLPLLDTDVAVILAYYAVLFVVAVPLLGLGARALAALGLAVALLAPFAIFRLLDDLPRRPAGSPTFEALVDDPWRLLTTLVVTGYYPVLGWTAYLCAGLAAGRLQLGSARVAGGLLAGGAGLATAAALASSVLLGPLGGLDEIAEVSGPTAGRDLEHLVARARFGTVPTTTHWWLATDAPHSTTPLDLLHTTGTALAVIGAALLLARVVRPLLVPLAAAGSMPLTMYCLHLLVLGTTDSDYATRYWAAQVVLGLAAATAWRHWLGRGPLERAVGAVTDPLRRGR